MGIFTIDLLRHDLDSFRSSGGPSRHTRLAFAAIATVIAWTSFNLPIVMAQGILADTGITVEGGGESRAVPDIVEINLKLAAKAELSDDAVIKHRDAKKRAIDTLKTLKLTNLEIEEKDLSLKAAVNMQELQMMMWNGIAPAQNKRTQVEVGSTLRARLTSVDKMQMEELMSNIGKLLDAAQDSGGNLGMSDADMMTMRYYGWGMQQNSLVKFIVSNAKETREKAYENAVADARMRAERLARLNGVKLGTVLAIDEVRAGNNFSPWYYTPPTEEDKGEKDEVVAESMSGGKVRIKLRVRFALEPAATAAVQNPDSKVAEAKK
jgi:uncharacterized protein YggE